MRTTKIPLLLSLAVTLLTLPAAASAESWYVNGKQLPTPLKNGAPFNGTLKINSPTISTGCEILGEFLLEGEAKGKLEALSSSRCTNEGVYVTQEPPSTGAAYCEAVCGVHVYRTRRAAPTSMSVTSSQPCNGLLERPHCLRAPGVKLWIVAGQEEIPVEGELVGTFIGASKTISSPAHLYAALIVSGSEGSVPPASSGVPPAPLSEFSLTDRLTGPNLEMLQVREP